MRFLALLAPLTVALSGCLSPPGDLPLGTTPHGVLDLREAQKTVRVYPTLPSGAADIQDIEAGRCHQNAFHGTPDDVMLTADLQILALRKGLNGISDLKFEKKGSPGYNCWWIYTGTGKAFNVK